ncbi:hypothetical protein Pryu01_01751 [Paraliobacillus ryukyuensis]|uniref:Uncharacterized protein YhaN n=1 Tax=Paraliobacillus ryukyuensis TaxID=200904 RepID=A0A366EA31_9BACI|nr:AAA family ATPase [Paraliobacillus ryukyuensis]RBO98268.1 uncharacterized protein YhaN [Paraliobacillus ryukyuensis]
MKIKQINIFGFGKWENKQFDLSSQSLVIVSGNNEAGKSTLKQFLLFMLFGMSPKERRLFLPKKGGKLGGRLTVETDDGSTFTIERLHDRNKGEASCYTSDGNVQGEDWLTKQLAGVNRETFLDIFAFDTTMLQKLHQIKQQDIGEILLGVGMAGTDQLYWTEKWLDQQLNQYFKPQGKKPKINQLLESLSHQAEEVTKREAETRDYLEKQQAKQRLQQEITEHQNKQSLLNQQLQNLKQKIHYLDTIAAFQQVNQELATFPDEISFPEQGLTRYDQLQQSLYPLHSEATVFERKLEKEKQQNKQLSENILSDGVVEEIEATLEGFNGWKDITNQLQYKQKDKNELEQQLIYDINQLNLDLNLSDIQSLSLPFATEDTWIQLKEENQAINQSLINIDKEGQLIKEQARYLQQEQDDLERRALKTERVDQLKHDVENEEKIIQYQTQTYLNSQQQEEWYQFKKKKQIQTKWLTILGLSLAFVAMVIGLLLDRQLTWFIVGLGMTAAALIVFLISRSSIKSMEPIFMRSYDLNQGKNKRTVTDETLGEWKQVIEEQVRIKRKQEALANQLRDLNLQQLKQEETKQFHLQRQERLNQKVQVQLIQFPFLHDVSLEHWPKLYHYLIQAIDQTKKYTKLLNVVEELGQMQNDYAARIRQSYTTIFTEDKTVPSIEAIQIKLKGTLDQHKLFFQQLEQSKDTIKQLEEQLAEVYAKMIPYQNQIRLLWEKANVSDEEAFLAKGELKQAYELLYNQMKSYRKTLEAVLTGEDMSNIIKGEPITKSELQATLENMEHALLTANDKIKTKQQQLADINVTMENLENSHALMDEKHRFHQMKSELRHQAKQWTMYQLARVKMKQTKQLYFQNYLPTVLAHTSSYFKRLTNGHYHLVLINEENGALLVEDPQGLRYTIAELSQGTKDQLYVSLRIGLSILIQRNHTMPFFVDDAFVHFDKNRIEAMVTIIGELSETHQIIWFTKEKIGSMPSLRKKNLHLLEI